ncbi:prepilin-type N-terminal cleavage/methylation domain-containing protein [Parelusimicrobium proximum]|uniref:type IV pilin protein n=1 Tax=Parelusimicrobium proximum TaxID=3228953 RepID=UPI003D1806A4
MKKGFTLIELLVVVLIIAILAAVALPQYTKAVEKSRATEAFVLGKSLSDAVERYYLANDVYPTNLDQLDVTVPGTKSTVNFTNDRVSTSNFNFTIHPTHIHAERKIDTSSNKYFWVDYLFQNISGSHSLAGREGAIYCRAALTATDGQGICQSLGGVKRDAWGDGNGYTYVIRG